MGGIGNCCCGGVTVCEDFRASLPAKIVYESVERLPVDWTISTGSAFPDCCLRVSIPTTSPTILVKRIFNTNSVCGVSCEWCTSAFVVEMDILLIPSSASPGDWLIRMDASIEFYMSQVCDLGGPPPAPETCAGFAYFAGSLTVSRSKIITSIAPTQTISFDSDDHLTGAELTAFDTACTDATEEIDTTVTDYCGGVITEPSNTVSFDFLDVVFDIEFTT